MWLLTLVPVLACSDRAVDSGARSLSVDSSPVLGAGEASGAGQELIPAEWTVFEDTSETGEVITASLQLPAAKDIEGLLDDKGARLILRCVHGRVEASIDTEEGDTVEATPIQLDSAPKCE